LVTIPSRKSNVPGQLCSSGTADGFTQSSEGSKAALIRNTRGGHLYYLLLASHNGIGVKIANPILSAGEVV
jgi:hypothetical protein